MSRPVSLICQGQSPYMSARSLLICQLPACYGNTRTTHMSTPAPLCVSFQPAYMSAPSLTLRVKTSLLLSQNEPL
eukprot:2101836-Rhodomonas_salina.1